MLKPVISVILPAYNSAAYIGQAIESVLAQSFTAFELLIINDGSTDDTDAVILGYNDPRITYYTNKVNSGLIFTLNRAIDIARGKYIARMDADDICEPTRLQLQYNWLEEKQHIALVGCFVTTINDNNQKTGIWPEDTKAHTFSDIRKTMKWQNCIAHPTIMCRAQILKQYKYSPRQLHCEDYDLWLRLLADKLVIEKVPMYLLQYREHQQSITGAVLRRSNPFFKQFRCKKNFLTNRIAQRKWGMFETGVLGTMAYDGIMGIGKNVKKLINS